METFGSFLLTNLTTILGVVVALTALVSAAASVYSARASAISAKNAQEVERRGLIRDIIETVQNTIAESKRVDDLGTKLTMAYQTLAAFAGALQSSNLQFCLKDVQDSQQEIAVLKSEAEKYTKDQKSLRMLSDDELVDRLTLLTGHLAQIRSVKEKLVTELRGIEAQIAVYRERAIKKF